MSTFLTSALAGLTRLTRRSNSRNDRGLRRARRACRRGTVELLETRAMLTTLITVNTFNDVVDAGDSVTSLREAVIHANNTAGDFEIHLPFGKYTLTRSGAGEDNALTGDLDILNNGRITIIGVGAGQSIITADGVAGVNPALGDRVFHVHSGAFLAIEDVTVRGGTAVTASSGSTTIGQSSAGGGFLVDGGTLELLNAEVRNNSAGNSGGGGILNSFGNVTITNSTLQDNVVSAGGPGGAIHNRSTGVLTITGSELSNNSADFGGALANQGAIGSQGESIVTITDSILSENSAGNSGGAITSSGSLTIADSTLSGNSANNSGGAVSTNSGNVTITGSTLSGNTAGSFGGAVFNGSIGTFTITDSVLSENTADFGGAIRNAGTGLLTITESELSGNAANENGGGIYNSHSGTVTISSSSLSTNTANNGGGIYNTGSESSVTLSNSSLSANSALFGGGGIYNADSIVTITTSTFDNNEAGWEGGAINNFGSGTVTITASTLSENLSERSGGAINNFGSGTFTITASTLSGNISASSSAGGGAIFNSSSMAIASSTLSGNSAISGNGGAIFNTSGGSLSITASTLSKNSADGNGGAIHNTSTGSVSITNSTISENTARFGGGIYNFQSDSSLIITGSTLTGNRAIGSTASTGGGLRLRGLVSLHNTIVAGNFRGTETTADDMTNGVPLQASSSYNLIGDPASAGSLVHGVNGNIVGDGNGNLLAIANILNTTLANNGGPTLTHALVPGSPAVNTGDPAFTAPPEFDQRGDGFDRVANGRIDIGAFEVQNTAPTAVLTASPQSGASPLSVTLDGSQSFDPDIGDSIVQYIWNVGNNQPVTTATPQLQHTFGFGVHSATLVVQDTFGNQSAPASIVITANAAPTAVLQALPPQGSPPLTVTLDGSQSFDLDDGDSIIQYRWNINNVLFVDSATPEFVHTFTIAGTYQATLVVVDSLGVQSAPASVTIVVNSAPTAVLTANPQSGASPLNVTLDGSQSFDPDIGDSIVRYIWNVGNNLPVQTNTPEFQFTYPWGQYLATLVVEDSFGNRSTPASIVITANAAPTAVLQALPPQGSPPLTVTLDGSQSFDPDIGDTIVQYRWNINNVLFVDSATPEFVHTFTAAGTYQATLVVVDSLGFLSAPASVTIVVNSPPIAHAGGPYTVAEGSSLQLDATGTFDNEQLNTTLIYEWDIDYDGVFQVDVTGIQPTVSFPDNFAVRTIAVRVTDNGGLSHIATTTLEVTNVAPTATFTASSLVTYGTAIAISFTDPFDPSSADTTAGFRYAFHLDPVALAGATYAASSADAADSMLLDAGIYTIYARIIDKDGDFTQYSTTVTVNPATLTVTADSQTRIYGDADPALTFDVSGFQLGDTTAQLTGALTRVAGENVGSYAIGQGTLDAGSNYTLEYVAANLSITPRSIEVTADSLSKTYGENDPPLTYQITDGSLAFVDEFFGELGREAGEDAGSYAINQGSLGLSSNYALRFVEAELVILRATLTGDATTQDALNMAKQGMLNITVSNIAGFVNGENAEVFLTNASFWIVIDDTKYEFSPTSVTKLSDSSISIRYSLKNSALLEAFGTALEDATSGKTAIEAGFSMESTNYSLSDDYLTRLFNTGK